MLVDTCALSQSSASGCGTDMYLSTLRSHIEAMGGELEIVARFPDGTVRISNFADLGNAAAV